MEPKLTDQEISMSLPLRIDLKAIENLLSQKLIGTNISKTDARGKTTNYFKILDLSLAETTSSRYNLNVKIKLRTLTLLFKNRDLEIALQADLRLDPPTQTLYVEAYHLNSQDQDWVTNNLLKPMLNTFIYKKVTKMLNIDLKPILKQKIEEVNLKLAGQLEAGPNISILGKVEEINIIHFEIKKNKMWILVHTRGWCVISIDDFVIEQP